MNNKGETSPQVDVIVLKPFYPKYLMNKKYYFTAGVVAAFECKTTLKTNHIEEALKSSATIKKLFQNHEDYTLLSAMETPVIYGLLAHSHSWKNPNSKPLDLISQNLYKYDLKHAKLPKHCLDVLCVSDLATWQINKNPLSRDIREKNVNDFEGIAFKPETFYMQSAKQTINDSSPQKEKFTALGILFSALYKKLRKVDKRIVEFSQYIAAITGHGGRIIIRKWSREDFNSRIWQDLHDNLDDYFKMTWGEKIT